MAFSFRGLGLSPLSGKRSATEPGFKNYSLESDLWFKLQLCHKLGDFNRSLNVSLPQLCQQKNENDTEQLYPAPSFSLWGYNCKD